MHRFRRSLRNAAVALALGALVGAFFARDAAAQSGFPFGQELLLDAQPMKGSKRVPSLDIDDKGLVEIELWCNSLKGQMIVAGDTITILTGEKTERSCAPERAHGDDEILAALNEATTWRREGDVLVLVGTRTIRFRLQTN
jgi:heat shock protein HslJ